MPTVSIVTPTYNRPDLLADAIQSVLAQTFSDWEMLIVEDGSDGAAGLVVAGFNDPRLRYIYQEHAGRSAARNRGLEAAGGEYIAFLDDDDLYHPDKLAKEVAFLYEHPDVDIVGSGYRSVDKAGDVFELNQHWIQKPEINFETCLSTCPIATCTVLIRRTTLEGMDHWFDPAFDLFEDTDFFLRLFLTGAHFAWLKEVLSDYRFIYEKQFSILPDLRRSYRQVFKKITSTFVFTPEILLAIKGQLIKYDLSYAWYAYAYGLEKIAHRYLLYALIQEPRLADEHSPLLLDELVAFAHNKKFVDHPESFLAYVFTHLPSPLEHLAHKKEAVIRRIQQ